MSMTKAPEEWLKQAKYDMDTADSMLKSRRYIYAVFMCHLSVEKALKALYLAKLRQVPPKTHNLILLLDRVNAVPEKSLRDFLSELNDASVVTRYPEDIAQVRKAFPAQKTRGILRRGREVLAWIKMQF